MTYNDDIAILVLSTDSFNDCWDPFFKLLNKYWDCSYKIYLATETLQYDNDKLNISVINTWSHKSQKRPTWSESLLIALNAINKPYVLLMLDDYFIDDKVDIDALNYVYRTMKNYDLDMVTLTEHGLQRRSIKSMHNLLNLVTKDTKYRLSTSPSIWKTSVLISHIDQRETGWEFEVFGSKRSKKLPFDFYIADGVNGISMRKGIVPYFSSRDDTGIIKGKWQKGIEQLFESNNIFVDFSKRGFYTHKNWLLSKYELAMHILRKKYI